MVDISKDMIKLIKECNCSPTYAFFMCMRMRGINNGVYLHEPEPEEKKSGRLRDTSNSISH